MTIDEKRQVFGEMLTEALDKSQMSDVGLAQATRINPSFITALKAGNFDELPGEIFGRGFIKSICKVMSYEEEKFLAEYNACWGSVEGKGLKVPGNRAAIATQIGGGDKKKSKSADVSSFFSAHAILKVGVPAAVLLICVVLFLVIKPIWQKANEISDKKETFEVTDTETIPIVAETKKIVKNTNEPPLKEEVKEAKKVEIAAPSAGDVQSLEVVVSSLVKVRSRLDNGKRETRELAPDTYRFSFKETAELLIFDAAAVDVSFNGRSLGKLGEQGRIRRLSFSALSSEKEL